MLASERSCLWDVPADVLWQGMSEKEYVWLLLWGDYLTWIKWSVEILKFVSQKTCKWFSSQVYGSGAFVDFVVVSCPKPTWHICQQVFFSIWLSSPSIPECSGLACNVNSQDFLNFKVLTYNWSRGPSLIQPLGTNWTQRPVSADGEGKSLRRVAMVQNFWISTNPCSANVAEKHKKLTCMTFLVWLHLETKL